MSPERKCARCGDLVRVDQLNQDGWCGHCATTWQVELEAFRTQWERHEEREEYFRKNLNEHQPAN